MATDVEIASLALVKLGITEITDLTASSDEARTANRFYSTTRDAYLSSYPWIFATKRGVSITVLTTTPTTEWDYHADLPAGLLRLIRVHDNGADIEFDLKDNKRILLNTNTGIYVDYIRQVPEADMPMYFVNALSWMLAADMAMTLTEDVTTLQTVTGLATFWDRRARHADSTQQPGRRFRSRRLINVRL